MYYIKTSRGWRALHKRHYEIANWWRGQGLDVEEKVKSLDVSDTWVSESLFDYQITMDRLF